MKLELPPLDTIKNIRKKVGWTQRELAKSAEISQSMIAKIENGRKSPSYETAQKIFHVLNMALKSYNSKNSGTAKDIATLAPLLTTLKPGDTVAEAIQLMGSDYDQLPVIMEGKCVGCISSKLIITLLSKKNVQKTPVYEVMEEPLPIIPEKTPFNQLRKTLEAFDCVLTSNKGKITGIVTRSDLIKKI